MKCEVKDVQINDCFAQGAKDGETSSCQISWLIISALSRIQQRGMCRMLSERCGTVEPLELGICKCFGYGLL